MHSHARAKVIRHPTRCPSTRPRGSKRDQRPPQTVDLLSLFIKTRRGSRLTAVTLRTMLHINQRSCFNLSRLSHLILPKPVTTYPSSRPRPQGFQLKPSQHSSHRNPSGLESQKSPNKQKTQKNIFLPHSVTKKTSHLTRAPYNPVSYTHLTLPTTSRV